MMPRNRIASSAAARRNAVSIDGYSAAPTPLRFSPVSTLTVTFAGATGQLDRGQQLTQLTRRGQRQLDVGLQRGSEVGARRVQPGQHRRGDAFAAQHQRLLDGGDSDLGGARRECGAGDLGGAVAVAVGLDDRHHLR